MTVSQGQFDFEDTPKRTKVERSIECPTCGWVHNLYTRYFDQYLLSALRKLVEHGETHIYTDDRFAYVEVTNIGRLRWWEVAEVKGETRSGVWAATQRGREFLLGARPLAPCVLVLHNEVVAAVGRLRYVHEFPTGRVDADEYAIIAGQIAHHLRRQADRWNGGHNER